MADLVDVVLEDDRWIAFDLTGLAQKACRNVLTALAHDPGEFEIALLGCGDKRIADLNADFRGKPQPTNVLSWPTDDLSSEIDGGTPEMPDMASEPGAVSLGDIAISYETCIAEAAEQSKPEIDHITHLLVHGCLHLLGYDHVSEKDAALMEGLEVSILANLGIKDPY